MFEWVVKVHEPPGSQAVQIYVFRRLPQGDTEFLIEGGKTAKAVKDSIAMANMSELSFATFPNHELADMLLAVLQNSGFNLPKADHTAGKLEATERHLEDMRKLVFKEGKK